MSRKTIATLATLASLMGAAAHAQDEHVALFKNVSGTITVLRNATTLNATPGMTLFVSDRLVSSAGASGGIVFKDGTLLTVGPSTEVEVRTYVFKPKESKYEFDVFLAKGSAVYSSGKLGKMAPEAVNVSTPLATVGVRGTRFVITAE